jgi:DNA-binding MurR/RpiR family transcriptional regulator
MILRGGTLLADDFNALVQSVAGSLSPSAARVAHFVDRNRATALASSAAQLAAQLNVSDATVIRAVQALGFEGLPALKQALASSLNEQPGATRNMRRTLDQIGADTKQAVGAVLGAHIEALKELSTEQGQAAVQAAICALHPAARIAVFGVGPSAHIARYVVAQLVRIGRPSIALDATGWGLADQLMGLRQEDAVLVLAYGRPYREVQAVMSEARRMAITVVLVTDEAKGRLAEGADVVVLARRGRANQVAVHAATLAALEAVVLGLAAADGQQALAQLAQLDRLRALVGSSPG